MSNFTIHQATTEHIAELLDLTLRAYEPIRQLNIHFAAANADEQLVRKNITENICFYMKDENKIVATASIRMPWGNHPGPFHVPHIWWVAVDPDCKRKGYSSILLDYIEYEFLAKQLRCPSVSLGTAKEHPWLATLYKKRGYKEAGEADLKKGHITVYLQKELEHVDQQEK